jgi:hypothetical protein
MYNNMFLAEVFDEWQRRYAENPDEFGDILNEDGTPVTGYGERCAAYFSQLVDEINNLDSQQPPPA